MEEGLWDVATKKLDLRNIVTSKALIEMNRILADPTFIHCFLEEVCEDFLFICFFKSRLTCLWRSHQTHWYTCLVICLLLIQPHYHCYHGYVENLLFFWHISSYHNSKMQNYHPRQALYASCCRQFWLKKSITWTRVTCLLKYMLLSGRMESNNRISLLSQGLPL